MSDRLSSLQFLTSAFALSSVGGLAALLRSQRPLTIRSILSATLYSGFVGLMIALTSYSYFGVTNPYFLLGVCCLAGIGGTTVLDFILQALKNGGINVVISPTISDPPAKSCDDSDETPRPKRS